ncbi:MAG: hypothetical protein ACRDVN_12610 [Jiangellaceae bacterium]
MPDTPSHRLAAALMTVTVAALLVACGDADDGQADTTAPEPPPTSQPAEPETPPADQVREIEVGITDGTVDTAEDSVEVAVGDTVRMTVSSDVDDEVHVHGVDRTAELSASRPTTLEFTVDEPGVFEVETHDSHLLLFQLLVR